VTVGAFFGAFKMPASTFLWSMLSRLHSAKFGNGSLRVTALLELPAVSQEARVALALSRRWSYSASPVHESSGIKIHLFPLCYQRSF
jgi:hypothetical protein